MDKLAVEKVQGRATKLAPHLKHSMRTRGHSLRGLFVRRCPLEIRKNKFIQRVVPDWNLLSEHVVTASTLNCFKSRLDKYGKDHAQHHRLYDNSPNNYSCYHLRGSFIKLNSKIKESGEPG